MCALGRPAYEYKFSLVAGAAGDAPSILLWEQWWDSWLCTHSTSGAWPSSLSVTRAVRDAVPGAFFCQVNEAEPSGRYEDEPRLAGPRGGIEGSALGMHFKCWCVFSYRLQHWSAKQRPKSSHADQLNNDGCLGKRRRLPVSNPSADSQEETTKTFTSIRTIWHLLWRRSVVERCHAPHIQSSLCV